MAKQPKLSLGVAIIAKDAAKTLPMCLESIRPYAAQIVVCVDQMTTDRTAKAARSHGAEVHKIVVSEPHECAFHGKVMAQHFARARDQSFTFLDNKLDWIMWLDADDILTGGDKLGEMLSVITPDIIGVWLPYEYAALEKDGRRSVNTIFHRERILRASVGWRWQYRVHEVVVPERNGPWLHSDLVRIAHQPGVHEQHSSAERNTRLLEIDLEENPEDRRAIFYMGNQYFARGDWRTAADWYERYSRVPEPNPYELWQSYVYMSMAYQKLGDLDSALQAAFGGVDCNPTHPEPYLQLAAVYLMSGEYEKALYWAKQAGEGKVEPPFFVFKNPMDYHFNRRVTAADALGQLGRIREARAELTAAHQVFPDQRIGEAIENYTKLERAEARANGFLALASLNGNTVELWDKINLPQEVRQFGRVRDVVMPAILKGRIGTQPRMVLWCVPAPEPWAPPKVNESGVGGSETAAIEIARHFAADGWRVDVYNDPGHWEGVYEGAGYFERKRLHQGEKADVMVSWRDPSAHSLPIQTRARLLWNHDLNFGPQATDDFRGPWDRVLGVSAWHAQMLSRYYGIGNTGFVPNGIDLARFDPAIRKVPWRCVYASAPDRGLLTLLQLWPRIVENEPGAELHVAYGWLTFDLVAGRYPAMQEYKQQVLKRMEQPGVVSRGRLPQDELGRLYSESYAWLYPCSYLEVSCISAMEAMAGGAVPVTSDAGALKETIGVAGAVVPGQPHSPAWQQFYVRIARGVLACPEVRKPLEYAGRERAKGFTWTASYENHWKPMVSGLLEGRREVVLSN